MPTARVIVEAAFTELGVKPPDQDLSSENANWGLLKLNRMISRWLTRKLFVYVTAQTIYEFATPLVDATPQYFSIGPASADFTAARPLRIERANLILNSSDPATSIPLDILDEEGYANLGVPGLETT